MSTEAENQVRGVGEEEPLLGERGDAQLRTGKPLYYNFILGGCCVATILNTALTSSRYWSRRTGWSMDCMMISAVYGRWQC